VSSNRARFKANERAYLDEWPMTEEQKQAVLARDLNRCIRAGGNIYFLAKIGATDGKSFQQMASSMTGMSEQEYQTGSPVVKANAIQGPVHPELGIAMDMSIQLQAANGAICTLSLSFNNDGPLGTVFRYIGDSATYIARYDDLVQSHSKGAETPVDVSKVDVSTNGIELQDREFFAAIRENREPNASVAQVLPCYRILDRLERQLQSGSCP